MATDQLAPQRSRPQTPVFGSFTGRRLGPVRRRLSITGFVLPFSEEVLSRPITSVDTNRSITGELAVRRDRIFYGLFSTLRAKDPYTAEHSLNVERLAMALCRKIGLDAVTMHNISAAAVLHDIGKLAVPDAVLTKPGRLTDAEFALMKRHPADGEAMLKFMADYRPLLPMIRHHHEWFDGSGYPDGLRGEEIPFEARIIQVADCVEAMSAVRSYAPALPADKIIEQLRRGAFRQFDPTLAGEMIRILEKEPGILHG